MRNISSLLISISVSRDRLFRSTPKIGHDLAKQPVTMDRNHWSRLTEMTGHDAPKYAAKEAHHTIILVNGLRLVELMYKFGVGVQVKSSYEVKALDNDFFENGDI